MKKKKLICFLVGIIVLCSGLYVCLSFDIVNKAYAKTNKEVKYTYDSLGRVSEVKYADGSVLNYTYDKNGNIKTVVVTHPQSVTEKTTEESGKTEITTENKESTEKATEETTKTEDTTENKQNTETKTGDKDKTENKTEESTDKEKPTEEKSGTDDKTNEMTGNDNKTEKTTEIDKEIENTNSDKKTEKKEQSDKEFGAERDTHKEAEKTDVNSSETQTVTENKENEEILPNTPVYAVDELEIINAFKRSMPIIKSLKNLSKNDTKYLNIKIVKLKRNDGIKSIGFQIRYSKKKNFKGYKTVSVNQSENKKYVTQKFKVDRKKIYYVKVRAFAKTKSGKKIYSKYSKVKKIKVGK